MDSVAEHVKAVLERLGRRKVVRWTLAYLAGAWLVLQVFDVVAGQFDWPPEVGRALTIALGIGAAMAVVVAWYHGERGRQRVSSAEFLILAGLAAIGVFAIARVSDDPADATAVTLPIEELTAVAVLPFAPRTQEEEDILFVDGVHDELLTRLAQLNSLHVISRTSVMAYRETTKTVPEIAGELRARYILEGAVQRAGEHVRINVQLIDAAVDDHLWAETFDRPLTVENLLTIQAEIATGIARALQAVITTDEDERLRATPTHDTEAYQLYLLGKAHFARRNRRADIEEAVRHFQAAVEEDPGFALAWADVAYARLWLYWGWPGQRAQIEPAYAALEQARALAPLDPHTFTVEAAWAFYAEYDYEQALEHLERAYRSDPEEGNDLAGRLLRHAGRWDEAVAASRRALEADPRHGLIAGVMAQTLAHTRDYDAALEAFDLYEAMSATQPGFDRFLAELGQRGDTLGMEELLERTQRSRNTVRLATYLRRDFQGTLDTPRFAPFDQTFWSVFRIMSGLLAQPQIARVYADSLRLVGEERVREAGEGWGPHDDLLEATGLMALAYHAAVTNRPDEASSYGSAAAQLFGGARDGIVGPQVHRGLANVYVLIGEYEDAISELEYTMSLPGPLTRTWLRYDPLYDPLRENPRFQALVDGADRTTEAGGGSSR